MLFNLDGSNGFHPRLIAGETGSEPELISVGDVNGDGFDDLGYAGLSFTIDLDTFVFETSQEAGILFGTSARFDPAAAIDSQGPNGRFAITDSRSTAETAPSKIRSMGDWNGDGIDDFGVLSGSTAGSQTQADPFQSLFVFYGRSDLAGTFDLDSFGPSDGFVVDAGTLGANRTLIGDFLAGDLDGDGAHDLIMTMIDRSVAPVAQTSWVDVVFGEAGGFGPGIDLDALGSIATHRFDASDDRFVGGVTQGLDFGGDINADGSPDLLIGGSATEDEAIHVVFGGNRPSQSVTLVDSMPPSQGLQVKARGDQPQPIDDIFGGSVAFVGDMTGDGIDDFAINNFQGRRPGFPFGGAFLIHGRAGGWAGGEIDLGQPFAANEVTEIYADSRPGPEGRSVGAGFGLSVAPAGDLNDDGWNDLLLYTSDGLTQQSRFFEALYVMYGGTHLNQIDAIARLELAGNVGQRMRVPGDRGGFDTPFSFIVEGGFDFNGDGHPDFATSDGAVSKIVYNPIAGPIIGPDISATFFFGIVEHQATVIAFDQARLGYAPTTQTIEITSRGSDPLTLQPAQIVSGSGFSFVNNFSPGQILQPGDSVELTIQLDTVAVGDFEALIRLVSDDPDEGAVDFTVRGEVVDAAVAEITYNGTVLQEGDVIDFNTLIQGTGNATEIVTVKNVGTANLSIGLEKMLDSDGFFFAKTPNGIASLAPGESTEIHLTLSSEVPGNKSATIERLGDGAPTISLVGAVTPIDAAPRVESIGVSDSTIAASNSILFDVVFTEPVSGVDVTDFETAVEGTVVAGAISVTPIDAAHYQVTVAGISGEGSLALRLEDDDSIRDTANQRLTGSFDGQLMTALPVGDRPLPVESLDLNSDGFPELLVGNYDDQTLSILPNQGSGTFGAATTISLPGQPLDLLTADFNDDGRNDLAVMTLGGLLVYLNDGVGGLALAHTQPGLARFGAVGDFNYDLIPDIAYSTNNSVDSLHGNGDGTFSAGPTYSFQPKQVEALQLGDDGLVNIISGNFPGSAEHTVTRFDVADLNQDDEPDFIYTSSDGLVVVKDGLTGNESAYSAGSQPLSIVATDLNGDGKDDVAATDLQEGVIRIFWGDGTGQLSEPVVLDSGPAPFDFGLADVDADGRIDLVVANQNDDEVTLIKATGSHTSRPVVIGSPEIEILVNGQLTIPGQIDFGSTPLDETVPLQTISAKNLSDRDLVVQPATFPSGSGFSLTQNFAVDQVIGPGETATIVVEMPVATAGVNLATLSFNTNDVDESTIQFDVIGSVVAPLDLVVTTTADSGSGSLRQAILDANQSIVDVTIRFDIPANDPGFVDIDTAVPVSGADPDADVFLIQQTGGQYHVNNIHGRSIHIDGLIANDDLNPNGPEIILDGSLAGAAGHGVISDSDDLTITHLGFQNWTTLAILSRGDRAIIEDSYFGIDPTGTVRAANGRAIEILDANDVLVRNSVLSGGTLYGLSVTNSHNVTIQGNRIGTSADGSTAIGNDGSGIVFSNTSHVHDTAQILIGGDQLGEGNVISGNGGPGIETRSSSTLTSGIEIYGNLIGVNATGDAAIPNGGHGVFISGATSDVTIGGSAIGKANVISGNVASGIKVDASGNVFNVTGNLVGTNQAGTQAIGNGENGVEITFEEFRDASVIVSENLISGNLGTGVFTQWSVNSATVTGNKIGTDASGNLPVPNVEGVKIRGAIAVVSDNLISGNLADGLVLEGANANDATIENNHIGTNDAADAAVANGGVGIRLIGAANSASIGSVNMATPNVISGNSGLGIAINGFGITQHEIIGNWIGTDPTGLVAIPNGDGGINAGGQQNLVSENVIAFNSGNGITGSGFQNTFSHNVIHSNTGLGIDLAGDGVTANDDLDADAGTNNLQNAPTLFSVTTMATTSDIAGEIRSTPSTTLQIELFDNAPADADRSQGRTLVDSFSVTTDSQGLASFSRQLSVVVGGFVTATATDSQGNTSEFSAPTISDRFDFGDAPASYSTLITDSGPGHVLTGPRLGALRDSDLDGAASIAADGDGDDEDGVMFGNLAVTDALAGVNVDLQNATTARVDAWLDFDRDGVFQEDERILHAAVVMEGLQTLNYDVPADVEAGASVARVRLSSLGGLNPTGIALDGEVEDYLVTIDGAPSVDEIQIAGAVLQRSQLSELQVIFNGEVNAPAAAFSVINRDTSQAITNLSVTSSIVGGRTHSVIRFGEGDGVLTRQNGLHSLVDGNYQLDINGSLITAMRDGAGMPMNVRFGDDEADAFFRFFGDADGDRDVDINDYTLFSRAYNRSSSNELYNDAFDIIGDGDVDINDYTPFSFRYNRRLNFS